MLRWTQPRRLVEVGSGFSSAVTLDTNDRYLDGKIACTFIEPNADRLKSLLKPDDYTRHTIIEEPVQTVGLDVFAALEAGDVLFVDSSHVSKIGGDLNRIMFDVLPRLAPGVLVHFHDLYWPFEYPKKFVYSGRAWNENYLVRAFLMYNRDFEICLFNDYLSAFHHDEVSALLPPWGVERGGSLWLRRV